MGGFTFGSAQAAVELKLGHIAKPGTAYDNYANDFKKRVEAASGGKYTITIYPSGQMGGSAALMEGLQGGILQLAVITTSDITQFVKELEVLDLPYMFENWSHVEKYLDSDAMKQLFTLTDNVGMKSLSTMPRGFRHVTTSNKAINSLADMKGVKIRVAESAIYIDTFRALGANPIAMAWSEVYTALQQGTVDGHENTIVTIRDYRLFEVQKYVSKTSHFFAFATLLSGGSWFNALPKADQAMFMKAAAESAKVLGQEQKNDEAAAQAELISKGMSINEVNVKEFEAAVQPVYEKFLKKFNRKYFDEIKSMK